MAVALEEFVKQLTDSGVIAPGKLEAFVPPLATPKDAQELALQLVKSRHLTKFQAQEIYQGRASSLTDAGPRDSRSTIARRLLSTSAWNVRSRS